MPTAVLVPDLLCLLACLIAAATDLRSYRIPNWLTFGAVAAAFAANAILGAMVGGIAGTGTVLLGSFAGGLISLIVFGLLAAVRFVGMGDAKLMVAVGAFLRWPLAIWALVYVAIAGGLLGVLYALARGRFRAVLNNIYTLSARGLRRGGTGEQPPAVNLHRIPYGLAILLGTTWAIATRYFPATRMI